MFSLFKNNSAFFIPYFVFLLAGGFILMFWSKAEIHLFINAYHAPAFDTFFKYYTNVGLGWLLIPVAISLSFVRLRYVIISLFGALLVFIVTYGLKQYAHTARPIEFFSELHQTIYTVKGVEIYHWDSFPSGHTSMAFCLFCIVALVSMKRSMKLLCFIAALLVAYSRMYLSEHFLIDVYAASLIGTGCAMISYILFMKLSWFNKFSRLDKPLINLQKAS